jgi:hypothetical protein
MSAAPKPDTEGIDMDLSEAEVRYMAQEARYLVALRRSRPAGQAGFSNLSLQRRVELRKLAEWLARPA